MSLVPKRLRDLAPRIACWGPHHLVEQPQSPEARLPDIAVPAAGFMGGSEPCCRMSQRNSVGWRSVRNQIGHLSNRIAGGSAADVEPWFGLTWKSLHELRIGVSALATPVPTAGEHRKCQGANIDVIQNDKHASLPGGAAQPGGTVAVSAGFTSPGR